VEDSVTSCSLTLKVPHILYNTWITIFRQKPGLLLKVEGSDFMTSNCIEKTAFYLSIFIVQHHWLSQKFSRAF
jgi:hypothetical protein